jgi:hypothetical protein
MADGTLFIDYISGVAVHPPDAPLAFWGRYIGGHYQITPAEAAKLHAGNYKILVIYNGATNDPASVQGGLNEGRNDAQAALRAAAVLAIPAGLAIFVDVENRWAVTSDWIRGWAVAIAAAGYAPGYYCNPNPHSSVFSNVFCVASAAEPAVANSLLYSCNPCVKGNPNPYRPAAMQPTSPHCGPAPVVWQYAVLAYAPALNPATDNQFEVDVDCAQDSVSALLW